MCAAVSMFDCWAQRKTVADPSILNTPTQKTYDQALEVLSVTGQVVDVRVAFGLSSHSITRLTLTFLSSISM